MSVIQYEFDLPKAAYINTKVGPVHVGEVLEYRDIDSKVFVKIRLNENLPDELRKKIEDLPQGISVAGKPSNIRNLLIHGSHNIIQP